MPAKGCFKAVYPSMQWQGAPCTTPPNRPYVPANQPYPPATGAPGPGIVGNGNDYAAEVTGLIGSATGSFPSVTGVTSESEDDSNGNPIANSNNTYSIQLNTKPFTTTVCAGHSSCLGWQQFIYSNTGVAFIQYWLLNYNATCPTGWSSFTFSSGGDIYCWENGPSAAPVAPLPITNTNLESVRLTGTADANGTDSVIMVTGSSAIATNQDSILNLAAAWQGVEFIIVGDGGGSQAVFNANATIVVNTAVNDGGTVAPNCVEEGFTGETNNLSLVGAPALASGISPAIEDSQSNIPGTIGSCASASGIGDTHLQTFGGLFLRLPGHRRFRARASQEFHRANATSVRGADMAGRIG